MTNRFVSFMNCANTPPVELGGASQCNCTTNCSQIALVVPLWQSRPDSLSLVSRQSVLAILLMLLTLFVGVGNAWGGKASLAAWSFSSTSYPSNKTDFAATSGSMKTSSNFYLDGSGSTWNTNKGYAFTSVTSITLTLTLNQALPAGTKIDFSADTYYNKASNAPMTGFSIKAKEGSGTLSTTGLSVTSWSLSTSSANKSVTYTTQGALASGKTIVLELTGTGKAGAGQGYFGNIAIEATTYTVSYNANGGSSTMTDSKSPYLNNSTVTVKENSFTAPSGKDFDKWNTKANGSGVDFAEGAVFSITKDTIFYAQWEASGSSNPTISSAPSPANSGTVVITDGDDNVIESGSEFTSGDIFIITAEPESGYGFGYWSLSTGSGATLDDADANPTMITMSDKTTTVTANFAQLATVADASNISCTGASFAITNSANRNNYIVYTTSSTAKPTDDGNSWSSNQYGNGTITISDALEKNTTYYYWCASNVFSSRYVYTARKSFTTTNGFDLYLTTSDGNGNTVEATKGACITSGTSVTLTAHPTSGYVLAGWTVKDEDEATISPTSTGTNTFTFSMPAKDVEAAAVFQQQVVAPSFDPVAGTYESTQSVAISTTTPSATIYYTIGTNPADPTTSSTPYTGAISVSSNQTIKAIAVKDGMANSAVSTAAYTIKCAAPEISLTEGTYTGAQTVTISAPTGATIYYTTDGSTPDNTKTQYTEAISVTSSQTIKAIAIKDGMANSEVASAVYTIQYTVTWKVNGVAYTPKTTTGQGTDGTALVNSGASVTTLPTEPDPADYCGQRFMGWTNSDMGSAMGQSAPGVLFKTTGDAPAVNGTTVYHAVFADYAN